MKTLYICGPMTGLPDSNRPAFNAAASELRAAGYLVFNPTENGLPANAAWQDHMAADLCALFESVEIYSNVGLATIGDTSQSKGATLELAIAKRLRLVAQPVGIWLEEAKAAA